MRSAEDIEDGIRDIKNQLEDMADSILDDAHKSA